MDEELSGTQWKKNWRKSAQYIEAVKDTWMKKKKAVEEKEAEKLKKKGS